MGRFDPTKTATLRNKFVADMKSRFMAVVGDVIDLLVTDDALDIDSPPLTFNAAKQFAFQSDPSKLKSFQTWFKALLDAKILNIVGDHEPDKPWTAKYVESAYKKGMVRSFIDGKGKTLNQPLLGMGTTKSQFLKDSFGGPIETKRVQLISTRAFEQLKGITADMGAKISNILAEGLSHGTGPRQIASRMAKEITDITKKRALTLARTEIIHAYSEGQLDALEDLGIDSVQAEIEFNTAGDDRVCPICSSLQGKIYTIKEARGLIPVHPNCRCAWLPYFESKKKGSLRDRVKGRTERAQLAKEAPAPRDYAVIKREIADTQRELQQIHKVYGENVPAAIKPQVDTIMKKQEGLFKERQAAIKAMEGGTPPAPAPAPVPTPAKELPKPAKTEPKPTPVKEPEPVKEKAKKEPKVAKEPKADKVEGLQFQNGSRTLTKDMQGKAEKVISAELEKLKKHPAIAELIGSENTSVTFIKTGDHVPNAPPGTKVLGVYYKDQKQIWMAADRNHLTGPASTGGWQVTSSLDGTFRHEFGHHFYHNKLTPAQVKQWETIAKPYIKSDAGEEGISTYGSTNASELFAEAFSFHTATGLKEGELPTPLSGFLKTHLSGKSK